MSTRRSSDLEDVKEAGGAPGRARERSLWNDSAETAAVRPLPEPLHAPTVLPRDVAQPGPMWARGEWSGWRGKRRERLRGTDRPGDSRNRVRRRVGVGTLKAERGREGVGRRGAPRHRHQVPAPLDPGP